MADEKLKDLTDAASFPATASLAGSDSAVPNGSFKYARSLLDAVYGVLAAAQTWAQIQIFTIGIRIGGSTSADLLINKQGGGTLQILLGDASDNAGLLCNYFQASQFLVPSGRIRIRDNGTQQMNSISTPAAPGAGNVFIYAKTTGGGKVALFAIFPSGAEQQIAIEP